METKGIVRRQDNFELKFVAILFTLVLLVSSEVILFTPVSAVSTNDPWLLLENHSTDIFTGTVIGKTSYWNLKEKLIYTNIEINIENYLKNSVDKKLTEEVTYLGGTVGNDTHTAYWEPFGTPMAEIGQKVKIWGTRNGDAVNTYSIRRLDSSIFQEYSSGVLPLTFSPPPGIYQSMKIGFHTETQGVWDTYAFPIPFHCDPTGSGVVGAELEVNTAFLKWVNEPSTTYATQYLGVLYGYSALSDDGVNMVFWHNDYPSVGVAGTVTYKVGTWPNMMTHGFDVMMNLNTISWTKDPASNPTKYDVQSVVVHESGHVAGLMDIRYHYSGGLENPENYVMYYAINPGENHRTLGNGDKWGIQYIYPRYSKPTVDIVLPADNSHIRKAVQFQVKASASCSDGISSVQFLLTDKRIGDQEPSSGWRTMTLVSGYWTGTYTVPNSSAWPTTTQYWIIVRAKSNRSTASQRTYGYHWHTLSLDP